MWCSGFLWWENAGHLRVTTRYENYELISGLWKRWSVLRQARILAQTQQVLTVRKIRLSCVVSRAHVSWGGAGYACWGILPVSGNERDRECVPKGSLAEWFRTKLSCGAEQRKILRRSYEKHELGNPTVVSASCGNVCLACLANSLDSMGRVVSVSGSEAVTGTPRVIQDRWS